MKQAGQEATHESNQRCEEVLKDRLEELDRGTGNSVGGDRFSDPVSRVYDDPLVVAGPHDARRPEARPPKDLDILAGRKPFGLHDKVA